MTSQAIDTQALVAEIDKAKQQKIRVYPAHTNRASDLGHPCERYLVFSRTRWQEKTPHDVGLQYIFDEGNVQEKAVEHTLREAGFDLTQQQRAMFEAPQQISGHCDGFISHPSLIVQSIPYEIKGLSAWNWASIDTYQSMIDNRAYYIRKYPAQLQMYMYQTQTEQGIFILKNKQNGRIKFISATLDFDYVEGLLKKAERINAQVADIKAGKQIDTPVTEEPDCCDGCGFASICFADKAGRPGIKLLDNPTLEALLKRWNELKSAAKEYKELDDQFGDDMKARMEQEPKDKAEFLVGSFLIQISRGKIKSYNVPEEVKQKYEEEATQIRKKVVSI